MATETSQDHAGKNRRAGRQAEAEQSVETRDERPHEPEEKPRARRRQETEKPAERPAFGFPRRHPLIFIAILILVALAIAAAVLWWLNSRQYVSTDDAVIDARTVTISAEVSGRITAVPVTDNQLVKKGVVLVRIDDAQYAAAVAQAKAAVVAAQAAEASAAAQGEAQQAAIDQAEKQQAQAKSALDFSRVQNRRGQRLLKSGAGTEEAAQQAAADFEQKQAAYASAQASVTAAQKQLLVVKAQVANAAAKVKQAEAAERQSQVDLDRTTIVAPGAGRATAISAAVGGYAQPGQALMMFVPQEVWVTADFKETDLADMRPGQPVTIRIDAYPDRTFHGHVDSIQAGSGTAFSLLPAENATGNFVKVVQRVPVKIVFDKQPDVLLGPGMSVEPTVKVE